MAGQGAGQVKRALKPGFLAGIVMNQKQHVLHLRLPRISFRSRGRCWTGMAMRSLRDITRVLTLDRKSTTSELQSLMRTSYAVFCLKKKQIHNHSYLKTKTRTRIIEARRRLTSLHYILYNPNNQ